MDKTIKILYVEDDELDQFVMKRTLKTLEWKTDLTMASSLHEGKLLAKEIPFDCIFLDYLLPDGSGIDFLNSIRKEGNPTPVVMLTSQSDTQIAVEAMKCGAIDYIPKNFVNTEGLTQSLRYVLRTKEAEEERQRILKELIEARKVAEEAAGMKEMFLANMSHEIRTPLSGIMALSKILLSTPMTPEQTEYMNSIQKCSDSLLVIINDILDLTKIQAGKMSLENVRFDVRGIVHHTRQLFSAKASEKNITINCNIDESVPASLMGDPTRLSQVLNNLVSNAIKFTEKGSVDITVKTKYNTETNYNVQFFVKDSGIGISEEHIGKIFESFTQAGDDITRKFGGTGLGLTIVKKLIELQNGVIKVESTHGAGTTFSFTLPFDIAITEANKTQMTEMREEDVSHLRILVAEDNTINQLIVKKLLEPWKCTLDFADNGIIAIEKLQAGTYDVVLMDVQMPEMDGYTASQKIRKELAEPWRSIPIMAMTAHVTQKEKQHCFECGMDDYISKPFDLADLKTKLIALTTHKKTSSTHTNDPVSAPLNIETGKSEKETQIETPSTKINLTYLKSIGGDNPEFIIQMIEMFLQKTPEALEEMDKKFAEQNWEDVRNIAHRIKPTYTYVGLSDIHKMLATIEKCCQAKENLETVPALIHDVETLSTVAFAELQKELKALK
jgi:signal transduction histidine kinase/HPt (histidine-containing phosphotransfer) domain-containing protein